MQNEKQPSRIGRPVVMVLAVLMSTFVFTAIARSEPKPTRLPAAATSADLMKTVLLPIEGMSCMSCAARVTKSLEALAGVADVEVNLADRNARIQYSPNKISVNQIVSAVKSMGYQAGAAVEAK